MKSVCKVRGIIVTLNDLPSPQAWGIRWTYALKHRVLCAIEGGLITVENCEQWWSISEEELGWWRQMLDRHGYDGLKITRCQEYRV